MSSIAENIAEIRSRMARAAQAAGRDVSQIQLVGASKMNDAAACRAAIAAGIDALGENRVQELLGKYEEGAYEGAPLHDGAVIIRGDKIYAAGCVLPLTGNKNLNKSLGTRHRAGIGITEHSDAISIIVSEETGIISMAVDGKLTRFLDTKTVEKTLLNLYLNGAAAQDSKLNQLVGKLGRKKDAR